MNIYSPKSRLIKLAIFLIALLFISYICQGISASVSKLNERICSNEPIAFDKTAIDDPNMDSGATRVGIAGANGTKKICINGYGNVVSEAITVLPVTEVTHHGSKPAPYIPPVIQYEQPEGGSICNDGSWSPSTGRGTCSWHGGVDYYL